MLFVIFSSLIILLLYISISRFIFKNRLQIEEKRLHPFTKGRRKMFVILEIIAILSFTVISFLYIRHTAPIDYSPQIIPKLTFVLLFIVYVIRGIEKWFYNRKEKAYYYDSLAAAMFLAILLIITFYEDNFY